MTHGGDHRDPTGRDGPDDVLVREGEEVLERAQRSGQTVLRLTESARARERKGPSLEKPIPPGALAPLLADLLPSRPTTPKPDIEEIWPRVDLPAN
ncbi:MAG: hypothetical protein ACOCYX_07210 [Spirochaetota bacterium]